MPPSEFRLKLKKTTMNSDMNNERRSQTSARGPFARWAVALAVLVALLALVFFTLTGWWAFRTYRELVTPPEPVTAAPAAPPLALKADDARANWSRESFTLKAADGLRQTSDSSWSVKGGRAFMQVRRQDDGSLELRFAYPFHDMLTKETSALLRTRWFLGPTEPLVGQLNITPEQLGQLKAISPATDIPVESADREPLSALFNDYLSAPDKPAAEKALVEAVVAMDAKYYDPTMQLVENLATQVRQIFTEEQWAGLSRRFGK